jgi:Lrp/AsnC family transcriptional regulator
MWHADREGGDCRCPKQPWGGEMKLDHIDLKILDLLQRDATNPVARIAAEVGLSQTPCWKRIQRYDSAGLIQRRVAILDPDKIGLPVTAFVMVEVAAHSTEQRDRFFRVVTELNAVCDVYRLAGKYDYLLRAVLPDMAAYDPLYEQLTTKVDLKAVTVCFALEKIKVSNSLPLFNLNRHGDRK